MLIAEIPDDQDLEFCECCARSVNQRILSINCDTNDISFLGSGYPLYFVYIKFSVFLLISMSVTNGLYRIITNSENGSDCKNDDTSTVFFLILF